MSGESLRIHPAAMEEAEAAVDWYAQRSRRAAGMFLDELDRAMIRSPKIGSGYPRHDFGTRRIVLRRFPFVIVFRKAFAGVGDHRDCSRSPSSRLLARAPRISQARLNEAACAADAARVV